MLKTIVKSIVPTSILTSATVLRERKRLEAVANGRFPAESLRQLSRAHLNEALESPAIGKNWNDDLERISSVMPYADIYQGVCPGERRAIYHLVAYLKPKNVVEIGTHIGASTLVIAQSLATHVPEGRMVTGDILDVNSPQQGAFASLGTAAPVEGLKRLGLSDRVRFEVKPAQSLLKSLTQKMDLIFLDGDHSAKAVYEELAISLDRLAPGGVIMLHDFYPEGEAVYPDGMVVPGPFLAAQRVAKEAPDVNFIPLGQLPWETKQGVRKTSLAIVAKSPMPNRSYS